MAQTDTARDELLGANPLSDYNADERHYSVHVRDTLLRLLKGDIDELDLLVRYHREPNRLGVVPPPTTVAAGALRLPRVEEILSTTIRFLHDGFEGGPPAQAADTAHGVIVQKRDFPTRFPHIVIQRTDTFEAQTGEPIESHWSVHRLQNQRKNVRINRILDAMNLGLELLKLGR